jgi:hypothetical protein
VIAADGRSLTPPATITTDTALASWLSAVFVGDAFYVAFSVATATNPAQLRLVRVGLGGELGPAVDALPGLRVEASKLVSGGNDLRLMYSTPSGATMWQSISLTGAALAPPVLVDVGAGFTWSFAALPFGSDTVGLLVGTGAMGALGALRLGDDGSIVAPPRAIARAYPWVFASVDVARRGPDVVLLWGTLRLARVTMEN